MLLPETFDLLVLGLGSTGLAVARWGAAHLGERVRSVTVYGGAASAPSAETDALGAAGVRFVFGTELVEGDYDVCVASPGISEFSAFFARGREHALAIMGEPEFAWRLSPEHWIAVTGTNGKTTTTSLVNHILNESGRASVAVGNIGLAPIAAVDDRAPGSWFAAELSSYQLATTSMLHPRVAVLMNITPDHLAWHGTLDAYAAAKRKIFANQEPGDLAVVCVEDAGARAALSAARSTGAAVCELSHDDSGTASAAFCDEGVLVVRLNGVEHRLVPTAELRIRGAHNELNALAAAAAALWVGASDEDVRAALVSFTALEHRIEPVAQIDGVRYINDSKATNTDAVEKALTAFPDEPVVLLLGGSDKGTPLEEFVEDVVHSTVRAVVCFGNARQRFLDAFVEAAGRHDIDVAEAEDLADAVDVARSLAERGDVVLLSPACASFDEFSGFEERGRAFKELVAALGRDAESA
ncbi:UDP-N-acetylmuramoyl-L-alanine--D-glutamate ligase [Enorma massiliensis]|uniref:UDP-N-acetylmuramoyl-L-alanine--D-glutamate ligase n=1 Tax=Enorma massiliensis TaxID=1472761 RepID=UPI003AB8D034